MCCQWNAIIPIESTQTQTTQVICIVSSKLQSNISSSQFPKFSNLPRPVMRSVQECHGPVYYSSVWGASIVSRAHCSYGFGTGKWNRIHAHCVPCAVDDDTKTFSKPRKWHIAFIHPAHSTRTTTWIYIANTNITEAMSTQFIRFAVECMCASVR